jgi:BCD family chlorophyll transporter-like MFS transporter
MRRLNGKLAQTWTKVGPQFLPFADAASADLPLGRLLRLSLFQVSVGMAVVLLTGTLNRVMIVELGVSAGLVAAMVALPLVFAPLRALIGFRSDTHRSSLGWRRVPYIWMGTLMQFGGLAIMPFALLVLSADVVYGPMWLGHAGAALAFLLVGAGLHTTQTAGLALATDLAPAETRPRVVALLYVMLLLGMAVSATVFSLLLAEFSQIKLIQIVQAAAAITVVLNVIALWKQEARNPERTRRDRPQPSFREAWDGIQDGGRTKRLLLAVFLGTAGFSMQDILLEPYGGEILGLDVGATTLLTAILAAGSLVGFAVAARALTRGFDPFRLAGFGSLIGIFAFSAVIFAAPLDSAGLFRVGTALIGFGGGLLAVGTLTAAMAIADTHAAGSGLALGAWGAVQATAAGGAIALGGLLRDTVGHLAEIGALGSALTDPSIGYSVVYHLEILLLFAALVAIGPLVRARSRIRPQFAESERHAPTRFGLAEFPG